MILCWNINSVFARIEHIKKLIIDYDPEIVLLQELKCTSSKFPNELFKEFGYYSLVFGQKAYNGVAILTKHPVEKVEYGLYKFEEEARYIEATIKINNKTFIISSVYVINGKSVKSEKFFQKINFLNLLLERMNLLISNNLNVIIGGDFNVAPYDIDVYNPEIMRNRLCFHIEEKKIFRKFLNLGYIDSFRSFNISKHQFSWWDYRAGSWDHNKGMRIDHILLSPGAADITANAGILEKVRSWKKPSDHAPLYIKLL